MRLIIFLLIFSFYGCSTTKSVLICGDHECINKQEAKLFFENNLTLEVKVISKKKEDNYSLVKMNLEDNEKNIKVLKSKNKKIVRKLTKEEIKLKKDEIKSKNIEKRLKKNKNQKKPQKKVVKVKSTKSTNNSKLDSNKNPSNICSVLDKCDIDTISNYLIKMSLKKDYPNIASKD